MTTYLFTIGALFMGYIIGQLRSSISAVVVLRNRVDEAWSKWLRTMDPGDYENFCMLKDRLKSVEDHGRRSEPDSRRHGSAT